MVSSPCLSPIGAKLTPYYSAKSSNGRMELVIVNQPEEQHRARYLTEGSRGAIKDITGTGHPVVKLNGYYSRQPIKLECYIGHDKHNGMPHLFYQASKISGKNSTQCTACKVEGTSVIVMNLLPEHGMQATIDCVGILKERNVDVEQKLLNLNHANKMFDFTEQQQSNYTTSAFASIMPHQHNQQPQAQFATTVTATNNNNNNNDVNSPAAAADLAWNSNQFNGTQLNNHSMNSNDVPMFKFERRDTVSSQIDENSIGAMSRADSFDDSSQDVSRHSVINSILPNHHAANSIVKQQQQQSQPQQPNTNNIQSSLSDNNNTANNHRASSFTSDGNYIALNSRKRSVRCRLVFRVKIPETGEVLQTISTPIICTQPLGTPEICRKSIARVPISSCNNIELFIIGKNFLKDTKVVFRNKKNDWLKIVEPDKEFLNSSHLICKIPNYDGPEVHDSQIESIEIDLQVRSGGKFSEPHSFHFVRSIGQTSCVEDNAINSNGHFAINYQMHEDASDGFQHQHQQQQQQQQPPPQQQQQTQTQTQPQLHLIQEQPQVQHQQQQQQHSPPIQQQQQPMQLQVQQAQQTSPNQQQSPPIQMQQQQQTSPPIQMQQQQQQSPPIQMQQQQQPSPLQQLQQPQQQQQQSPMQIQHQQSPLVQVQPQQQQQQSLIQMQQVVQQQTMHQTTTQQQLVVQPQQQQPQPPQQPQQQIHVHLHEQQQQLQVSPAAPQYQSIDQIQVVKFDVQHNQQQTNQTHIIQDGQLQQQILMQQQSQQQQQQQQQQQLRQQQQQTHQVQQQQQQAGQLLTTTIDLNDETTVVYADTLPKTSIASSIIQNGCDLQTEVQHIQSRNETSAGIGPQLNGAQLEPVANGLQQTLNEHTLSPQMPIFKQKIFQHHLQQQPQIQDQQHPQLQQQQFDANIIRQELQQHLVLQHQSQQQQLQIQPNQIVNAPGLDLSDDTTVIYADAFPSAQGVDGSTAGDNRPLIFPCNFS